MVQTTVHVHSACSRLLCITGLLCFFNLSQFCASWIFYNTCTYMKSTGINHVTRSVVQYGDERDDDAADGNDDAKSLVHRLSWPMGEISEKKKKKTITFFPFLCIRSAHVTFVQFMS